jgi:hypothetical protein
MMPRLSYLDEDFILTLRESIEQKLTRDVRAAPNVPAARRIYSWDSLANGYARLAAVAYAAGDSLDACRKFLRESAIAHLELVKLRGNGTESGADWISPAEYSTGNSRSTFMAICSALASGDRTLATTLAPWVWDPEGVTWLSPQSVICSTHQQTLAYALKDVLLGRQKEAAARLDKLKAIREETIGEVLMLDGVVVSDAARIMRGLEFQLKWNRRKAKEEDFTPDYFLCVSALGLCALGIQEKVVTKQDLPDNDVYFPRDLIG